MDLNTKQVDANKDSIAEDDLIEEIIELGEDTLEYISGSRTMVCDTPAA